jgi:RNA polymerase sigma factor (sigma-70 family)
LQQSEQFSLSHRTTPQPNPTNLARRPLSATQAASGDVLIARIAQGERLAMQVLYGRRHVRVFRFGIRLLRDEQVAEDLISEVLRQCLTAISPEHREIVDLVYDHEKSVEEVAEIVGIPENTVKTRLFYARRKLAELLKAASIERGWP